MSCATKQKRLTYPHTKTVNQVDDYFGVTELKNVNSYNIISSGNELYIEDIFTGDLGTICNETGEFYEGMIVLGLSTIVILFYLWKFNNHNIDLIHNYYSTIISFLSASDKSPLIIATSNLFNTLIFNFRWWLEYNISVHVLYVILLSVCFKDLSDKIIRSFCIILITYVLIFLPITNSSLYLADGTILGTRFTSWKSMVSTRPSQLDDLCSNFGTNKVESWFIFERYAKQFDAEFFSKICNVPKSRFSVSGDKYFLE